MREAVAGAGPDHAAGYELRLRAVPLSDNDYEDYYEGYSNSTLWPLYHDAVETPAFPSVVVDELARGDAAQPRPQTRGSPLELVEVAKGSLEGGGGDVLDLGAH